MAISDVAKEVRHIYRALDRAGWDEVRKRRHVTFRSPDGVTIITLPCSRLGRRGRIILDIEGQARSAGVDL
jgi:predicted RNA binding protein YcfA (HicA-like mRNA interferase family)